MQQLQEYLTALAVCQHQLNSRMQNSRMQNKQAVRLTIQSQQQQQLCLELQHLHKSSRWHRSSHKSGHRCH